MASSRDVTSPWDIFHISQSSIVALQRRHNGRITIVYSAVYSGADQRKHESSASLAFVREIHRWPVNSPHKGASNVENVSISWRHHGSAFINMFE